MEVALCIAALWAVFGASHMTLSSQRFRPVLVERLGEGPFMGLYSLLALGIFVPLVWLYIANRHTGPYLGSLAGVPGLHPFMLVGMCAALALLVAGLVRPSPASVVPGEADPGGVFQVTRHPLLMSMGLFGFFHLLVVAIHATEFAFFLGFPVFVLIGCAHQDRRKLATAGEAFQRFYAATPFLPFSRPSGVVQAVREQPLAIASGVGLAIAVRALHPAMFGVG